MEYNSDKLPNGYAGVSDEDCPSDEEMELMIDEIKTTCDELMEQVDIFIQKIDDVLKSKKV